MDKICQVDLTHSSISVNLKRVYEKTGIEILYFQGSKSLLFQHGRVVGFSGSRDADARSKKLVYEGAKICAKNGLAVISGGAAGIDYTAMRSVLSNSGEAIFILPMGINYFKVPASLEDMWSWDRVLVVSQFELNYPWNVGGAMARNAVISSWADKSVIAQAKSTGGTVAFGKTALKQGAKLYVAQYPASDESYNGDTYAGNRLLLKNNKTTPFFAHTAYWRDLSWKNTLDTFYKK